MLEISGDILEGGGQILRTSLALATLLGKDLHIYNIRGRRKPPGLRPQHITGIKAVAGISKAKVIGLEIGSQEFFFRPQKVMGGNFRFEVGTAGSISLILQAVIPTTAFSSIPTKISISGGTDVKWSPTIDYMRLVVLPILSKMGVTAQIAIKRRGHYPKGGGEVLATIEPIRRLSPLQQINMGEITKTGGISHCVNLPIHVAERQARAAVNYLAKADIKTVEVKIDREHLSGLGPGSGIMLYAMFSTGSRLGSDALGEKGKPAEKVGEEAAEKLLDELRSNMCLDRHTGDMVIPYMALAEGESMITVSKITLHTLTNIRISELITGVKFNINGKPDYPGTISVNGIGLAV
jgi:RNA 3'-terminal phosphate cyclase (ATP)